MNIDKDGLASLLERVREAKGPDREIDAATTELICEGPGEGWTLIKQDTPNVFKMDAGCWIKGGLIRTPKRYTASIDDSLALVERLLPGWRWGVSSHSLKDGVYQDGPHAGLLRHVDGFRAHVTERSALRPMPSIADARTAPLAILAALLSALKEVR